MPVLSSACIRLCVLTVALACIAACPLVSRDEVARIASPDGRVEAVLVETNGGATTSFGYEVHVVGKGLPAGNRVAWLYRARRNANAYGAKLRWAGENQLVTEFLEAREQVLEQSSARVWGRNIEVSLRSGVDDPGALAGAMLYSPDRKRAERAR